MKNQTYREFAEENKGVPPATLRLFFRMFSQLEKSRQEAEKRHREDMAKWRADSEAAERRHAEDTAKWRENSEAAEKRHAEDTAKWRENSESAEKRHAEFRSEWGSYTSDESDMLEEQVAAAIRKTRKIGGMKADIVNANMPVDDRAQFDIVCLNGKEAMLLEVKRTLNKGDVAKFVAKMPVFAEAYPALVKGKKITGAMVFQTRRNPAAIAMALAAGLRVFRAEGEKTLKQITQ